MPSLLNKVIVRLPSWLLDIFDTSFTRTLYVKLHQLKTLRSKKIVNDTHATFYFPISEEPGTEQSTILKSHPLEHDFINHVEVKVVRLDDYILIEDLPKPDLIKIDIEGAGLKALKGLSRFLSENNPDIFIETHKNSEEITNFLKKHGYSLTQIFANRDDKSPIIIAE